LAVLSLDLMFALMTLATLTFLVRVSL
jgi:hypothetical protein